MVCKIMYISSLIKLIYYKATYMHKNVRFDKTSVIGGFKSRFEGCNRIGRHTFFAGEMGFGSYIGSNCTIYGKVGKYYAKVIRLRDGVMSETGKYRSYERALEAGILKALRSM